MSKLESLLPARAQKLVFYYPYYFIRENEDVKTAQAFINRVLHQSEQNPQQIITITTEAEAHLFLVEYLSWDSVFFQRPVYKLFTVLFSHQDYRLLKKAVAQFKEQFFTTPYQYCFIEVPAEDTLLMQALNANGFLMIETRLAYFRPVADFTNERYAVRKATGEDIGSIRNVAASAANPYDRFHAEPAFSQTLADAFLGKYAEEAVKGYCSTVLVPDEANVPVEAFLALDLITNASQQQHDRLSKIVLTAVAPACKGWHYKLMSEAVYQAQAEAVKYIVMTTQATNKAVIRNCEKLGFSLGSTRHILSYTVSASMNKA